MCGIAGCFSKSKLNEEQLDTLRLSMRNRGPDHFGAVSGELPKCAYHLLHSRLGIIDLDARANQPMEIDGRTIVLNGEIYNYLEVREALSSKGVRFLTESDTEVLLQAYIHHGERCVDLLEGMWAFAILDTTKNMLFLSRDRFGEKPLYYIKNDDNFFFASQTKFLKLLAPSPLQVNERQLHRYLVNGYKSLYKQNETFFSDVYEIPFATNMLLDLDTFEMKRSRYWFPRTDINHSLTEEQAIQGFKERFIRSMRIRLRSDVPMAFCLSGGVDSASIVSVASKLFGYDVHAFSIIDPDKRYNERANIEATVNDIGCRSTMIELEKSADFGRLAELIAYHDAPVATLSYYVHSFLSRRMHEEGYKVSFLGTAADELVTGYYDHYNLFLYEMRDHPDYELRLREWENGMGRVVRNPYLKNPELYSKNPDFRGHIYLNNDLFEGLLVKEFHEEFREERYTSSLLRNRMLNELFNESTPVILHEDDLNSMFYSIENRSPYLDSELCSFSYSIPTEHLIKNGMAKHILRSSMAGILNDRVRLDPHKKGFNASVESLFDLRDPSVLEELTNGGPSSGIVDQRKLRSLLDSQESGIPNSVSKFLFYYINAKIFLETVAKKAIL